MKKWWSKCGKYKRKTRGKNCRCKAQNNCCVLLFILWKICQPSHPVADFARLETVWKIAGVRKNSHALYKNDFNRLSVEHWNIRSIRRDFNQHSRLILVAYSSRLVNDICGNHRILSQSARRVNYRFVNSKRTTSGQKGLWISTECEKKRN